MIRNLTDTCHIDDTEQVWPAILQCRRLICKGSLNREHDNGEIKKIDPWLFYSPKKGGEWQFAEIHNFPDIPGFSSAMMIDFNDFSVDANVRPIPPGSGFAIVSVKSDSDNVDFHYIGNSNQPLKKEIFNFLSLYVSVLIRQYFAIQKNKVFVSIHLAQTLDGKIAAESGSSQWIGNSANRKHAHRMRALHDCVMVGANTFKLDEPRLNVREVSGDNPVRVIIEGRKAFQSYNMRQLSGKGKTLLLLSGGYDKEREQTLSPDIMRIIIPFDPDNQGNESFMSPESILKALKSRRFNSLFIEGGGITISHFLKFGLINLIHLHIAPIILGSGRPGFILPTVSSISEGRRFSMCHFNLDDEILLELNAV